jgi:hypothetical protein
MAHLDVDPLSAQATDEVGDAKNKSQADNTLREFRKCAEALRHVLYQDRPLTEVEFLFIDNHFQVLEMAYLRWKRKHNWPADFH